MSQQKYAMVLLASTVFIGGGALAPHSAQAAPQRYQRPYYPPYVRRTPPPAPAPTTFTLHNPPPEIAAFKPFAGKWTGTLEYSDFQTHNLVTIPTTLETRVSTDGYYFISDYQYQDPGTTIEEFDVSTVDPKTHKMVTTSFSRGVSGTIIDAVPDLIGLLAKGQGQLIYTRNSHDGSVPVEVRETDTFLPGALTFLSEGRHKPTDPFVFRDRITLKRQGVVAQAAK